MRKSGEDQSVRLIPRKRKRNSFPRLIRKVTDETLLKNMNRLAQLEDYEGAIIYRDELRRRQRIYPAITA